MYRRDAVARQSLGSQTLSTLGAGLPGLPPLLCAHHSDKVVPSAREIAGELVKIKIQKILFGEATKYFFCL